MKSELDVRITAGMAILLFLIFAVIEGQNFANAVWSIASKAISLTWTIRFVFTKWVWKWRTARFLERFHGVPYLEGKWSGEYISSGNPNTPPERLRGAAEVEIVQPDLRTIKVIRRSNESTSRSFGEEFLSGTDGIRELIYSYRSEPKASVRERSPISYGSAHLELNQSQDSLDGNYWTDVRTTGELHLKRQPK